MPRLFLAAFVLAAACATAQAPRPTAPATRTCAGTLNSGRGAYKAQHKMLWLQDGALITTCSVSTPGHRSSAVDFWLPQEEGHAVAACAVTEDVAGVDSGGLWVFNNRGDTSTIGYVDQDSAAPAPMTMACTNGQ